MENEEEKMKRKLLCGLLALMMCLSLLPGAAWAEDTGTAEPQQTEFEQPEEQPTATERPAVTTPEPDPIPAPEQPAPEQPAPEQPVPEQPTPEQPAPEGEGGGDVPPAQEQPECVCTAPCAEGSVNAECPVCGAENADLTACKGQPVQTADAPTELILPVCSCEEPCTEEHMNAECPVCGAEGAAIGQCGKYMPVVLAAAANGSTVVTDENKGKLGDILNDAGVTDIIIKVDVEYAGNINAPTKNITVSSGCTFTWSRYSGTFSVGTLTIEQGAAFATSTNDIVDKRTVSGNIINNGTITIGGTSGNCYWNATTIGTGSMTASNGTYFNYGNVPPNTTGGRINIVKDISDNNGVTVSLPTDLKVGDTAKFDVKNLIDGINLSDVFTFNWKMNNSSFSSEPNPTLTQTGSLKLKLTLKDNYCMRSSSGTRGSSVSSVAVTVAAATFDTVYVSANGSDGALGSEEAVPVDTLREALKRVSEGGTIILLSALEVKNVPVNKNVTVKSKDGSTFTLTSGGFDPLFINSGKTLTLDNVAFSKDSSIKPSTGASGCTLRLQNCGASGSVSVQGVQNVILSSAVINGTVTDAENIVLNGNAEINGSFYTNNLTATGSGNKLTIPGNNATATGSITVEGNSITLEPGKLERGTKLIQVPQASKDDITKSFVLSNDENGKYALKCRTPNNGQYTYIGISQRIESTDVKFAVLNEPVLGETVFSGYDVKVNGKPDTFYVGDYNSGRVWSGYNAADGKWAVGDVPQLTLVLSATIPSNDYEFWHFDDTFKPSDVSVYTWILGTDTTFTDANLRRDVTAAFATNGKAGNDGRTLSLVLTYPKITKAAQTVTLDTAEAALGCKETLTRTGSCTSGAALTYTSSDPTIASVDPKTGVVTALRPGTVTITAAAPETEQYTSAAASYTVTVSHKFADTWQSDANEHWKLCACGEKGEKAAHSGGTATCTNKAKCEVCGAEYGALDPKNHSDLRHVPARGATYLADGNIEYWYCAGCTRYYLDSAATRETTLAATVIPRLRWYDGKNPRTGDDAELALPLALFVSSAVIAAAAALLLTKKRALRGGKQKD